MKKQNHKAFFFIGIVYIGAGVVFLASVNSILGLAFIALGLMYMVLSRGKK